VGRGRGAAIGAAVLGGVLLVSTGVAGARISPSAVASSNPSSFAAHDGKIYFVARKTGPGTQIWRSDGTAGSLAAPLYTVASDAQDLTWGKTKLYWIAGGTGGQDSLFVSDGVHAPTELALPSEDYFTSDLLAVGDLVFFGACTVHRDCEPWLSDGTPGGTHPVSDIFPGVRGSYPFGFTRFGPFALFAAEDGVHGRELWISGGGGATMVKNFAPGAIDGNPYPIGVVNGRAVVTANDDVHGDEPWTTDGNGPNTKLLRNIAPGTNGSSEGAGDAASFKGKLYFDADDGVHGDELWMTDGTKAGTTLVADIFKGPISSYAYGFIATTKLLYFVARDKSHGDELWATGGTAASTRLVKELTPGNNVDSSNVRIDHAAARGASLLFSAYAAGHGYELWSSHGTADTTSMLKEIGAGSASSNPAHLTRAGTEVYFSADDGVHGVEPWVSDGTKQGTHMIRDLRP
jgi:ELWxxDGT repeat protein